MAVRDEAWPLMTLQMRAGQRGGWRRHGVDFNRRPARELMREVDRSSVDEDEINLRMWNPAGFDRVFDRGLFVQLPHDCLRSQFWPNEKRKIAVKPQVNREGLANRHRLE